MEVFKIAKNRWEVRGELPVWRFKGVEPYSRIHTTKKAAEASARRWRIHIVNFKRDMEDERFTRLEQAREYLTARAMRPSCTQLTMVF